MLLVRSADLAGQRLRPTTHPAGRGRKPCPPPAGRRTPAASAGHRSQSARRMKQRAICSWELASRESETAEGRDTACVSEASSASAFTCETFLALQRRL